MKFQQIRFPRAVKLIKERLFKQTFTGDETARELVDMMLIYNKQGSTGVEDVLCSKLGLHINVEKHGFDARHPETSTLLELKPSRNIDSLSATYNDLTIKKIKELETTPNNKVVFAGFCDGEMVIIAMVPGQSFSKILAEKYTVKEEKIFGEENTSKEAGEEKIHRQTHSISLLSVIKKLGKEQVEVLFYTPHHRLQKSLIKTLELTNPVDKLGEFSNIIKVNAIPQQQFVADLKHHQDQHESHQHEFVFIYGGDQPTLAFNCEDPNYIDSFYEI